MSASPDAAGAPAMTSVNSPRGSTKWRSASDDAAAEHLLVELRQLAADGDVAVAQRLLDVGQRVAQPVRRLEGDQRLARARPAIAGDGAARPRCRGRKPRYVNVRVDRPETASAVVIADGPGTGTTRAPRLVGGADQVLPGVAYRRHPGLRDERDVALRERAPGCRASSGRLLRSL